MPLDLSPVTSILQAFELGYNQRKEAERLQFEKLFRGKQLEQQDKQFQTRMKQAESQFKATQDYRRSQIDQAQATLDYHKAVEEARAKREASKMKLDWLRDYSEGKVAFPRGDYTGTGEEFSDVSAEVPESFSPVEGVNILRSELPEVYGKKEQQADIFKRMEMQAEEAEERNIRTMNAMQERNEAAIAGREAIAQRRSEDLIRSIFLKSQMDREEAAEKAKGDTPTISEINEFVRGTRPAPPAGSKEWRRLSNEFNNYEWTEYNQTHPEALSPKGYSPLDQRTIKELQDSQQSKAAIEFAFDYATALDDWLKGTNKEKYRDKGGAFAEVVRLYRNVDKFIPHLRQGASLGVLSTYDLRLLRSNLPDITGAITERAFKSALPKGESWNIQRAIELAKVYKNRYEALTGGLVIGQKAHEWKKWNLAPRLSKEHQALLGGR